MINDKLILGIDFGGTWIRAALIKDDTPGKPRIFKKKTISTRKADYIIDDIVGLIKDIEIKCKINISSIGIGVPTTINSNNKLDFCRNLPTMNNYPLQEVLQKRLSKSIFIENDANCYAYGEWLLGVAQGSKLLACITIGTGIGLGIIYKGKILRGTSGKAGEIWCSPIDILTDRQTPGYLEPFVSGKGIEDYYQKITGHKLSGEEVYSLAKNNNINAISVFNVFGSYLGNVIRWIINILDPDLIVLGGSVSRAMSLFIKPLLEKANCDEKLIAQSKLFELAAIYGAAQFARMKLK